MCINICLLWSTCYFNSVYKSHLLVYWLWLCIITTAAWRRVRARVHRHSTVDPSTYLAFQFEYPHSKGHWLNCLWANLFLCVAIWAARRNLPRWKKFWVQARTFTPVWEEVYLSGQSSWWRRKGSKLESIGTWNGGVGVWGLATAAWGL